MIPYDFTYYRPVAVAEANQVFQEANEGGQETHYYGGGTEIITISRLYSLHPDVVVDIKDIPECNVMEKRGNKWVFGAALTLIQITEANPWQLLSECAGRIADHTTRGKITLGGNLCGQIPYRESILPFLLADADIIVAGAGGLYQVPLRNRFQEYLHLEPGEFLVQVTVDDRYTQMPFMHVKRTRLDWIDYPLLTVAVLKVGARIRWAFSGFCPFPFRSAPVEDDLNDTRLKYDERIDKALGHLPDPVVGDTLGLPEYRMFVFRNTVRDILIDLEE